MLKDAVTRWFYHLSIRTKIIMLLYAVILLMVIILSCALLFIAERNARGDVLSATQKSIAYNNLIIEKEQQYLYGIAAYYAIASEVQELILQSNAGWPESRLSTELISVSQSRQYVLSIAFYNAHGENIDFFTIDGSYGPIDQDPLDRSRPFYKLINGHRTYVWEYIEKDGHAYLEHDNSPKICLWYVVKDNSTWTPIGVMSIALDSRKLFPIDSVLSKTVDNMMIIDSENETIFGRGDFVEGMSNADAAALLSQVEQYQNTGSFKVTLDGQRYYATYGKVPGTSFISFLLTEDRMFFWNMETFFVSCLIGLGLCLGSLLPILILVSNFLTRPLNQLMTSMERFRTGDRDVQVESPYYDEIGRICSVFNAIVKENKQLIEQTYLLTIRNQAAELAKLQAQINPHFIYNTLNIIQWMAIDKGDDEIAEMTYSVGRVFRLSLSQGRDFVTIAEERELLYFFLSIQQKRFGNRLSYTLDFAEDILDVSIPKLLIQPLVENASIHGVKNASSSVHISVRVTKEWPERIHIVVEDDGIGIAPEVLERLPNRLDEDHPGRQGSSFALKNIAKRLQLYYDGAYVFNISSKVGQGTTIVIDIPCSQ